MARPVTSSFLLALALLAIVEIALRCLLAPNFTASFLYGFHPSAGFEERADGTVRLVPSLSRNFHAQQFSRHRPDGVFRVFALGDSVEFFDGIASRVLSNTYPWRVGQELRERGIKAESINLAVTGYGSRKNEVLLKKALEYEPSLMVLKVNDSNDGMDSKNLERAEQFQSWHPKNWLRKSYLVQTLLVLNEDLLMRKLLPQNVMVLNQARTAARPSSSGGQPPEPKLEEGFCRTIRESVALVRARNIPVVLVTQAWVESDATGRKTLADHGLDAFAQGICGPGVACVSLKQVMVSQPLDSVFIDHMHLSPTGHRVVARAIADRICLLVK
jgi:hypothetical protein